MTSLALNANWPWLLLLIAAVVFARMLVKLSGGKWNLARLRDFHDCQEGSVQSLSFVMTLPLLLMTFMLIIQVSHIMIGNIVINYAAFASVRSAIVWIPANIREPETENRISTYRVVESDGRGTTYEITPQGLKFEKISQAGMVALLPIAPSRNLGYTIGQRDLELAATLRQIYAGAESYPNNLDNRLVNKFGYVRANTEFNLRFTHFAQRNIYVPHDPPLALYRPFPWPGEFAENELGWQDKVSVTITHQLALPPGPVSWFASRDSNGEIGMDASEQVYVWPIRAKLSLGNEGEKPLISFPLEIF